MPSHEAPSISLSSVLSGRAMRSAKSVKALFRDIKKNNELSTSEKKLVERTLLGMHVNPKGIKSKKALQVTWDAMGNAGQLKGKFKKNAHAGLRHMRTIQDKQKQKAQQQQELRKQKNISRTRKERQWEERKEEVLETLGIHDTSLELKKRKDAVAGGISQVIKEKEGTRVSASNLQRDDEEGKVIDMMID